MQIPSARGSEAWGLNEGGLGRGGEKREAFIFIRAGDFLLLGIPGTGEIFRSWGPPLRSSHGDQGRSPRLALGCPAGQWLSWVLGQ